MGSQRPSEIETLEGYVVDIACLRKYGQGERLERAQNHGKDCALMGHCAESGFGLVTDDGALALLDGEATLDVVRAVEASARECGIRLRVTRERDGREMKTRNVALVPGG